MQICNVFKFYQRHRPIFPTYSSLRFRIRFQYLSTRFDKLTQRSALNYKYAIYSIFTSAVGLYFQHTPLLQPQIQNQIRLSQHQIRQTNPKLSIKLQICNIFKFYQRHRPIFPTYTSLRFRIRFHYLSTRFDKLIPKAQH